jgi:predicted O-methyltransferase YrrM
MKNIVILGSGRSGTSLTAGLFATAGYFMGDKLYDLRESNPKGFFEDPEINGVNEEIISALPLELRYNETFQQGQYWLSRVVPGASPKRDPEVLRRIQSLIARGPFCFKDPRFSYTLPIWRPFLADTLFICVFRDPATTVRSIIKECNMMPYLASLQMDVDRAISVWNLMYRHILDALRFEGEWMFLHYDQCFEPATLDRIEALTGARIDRSFPEKSLKRSLPDFLVPPETEEIYTQLCGLAGFSYDEGLRLRNIIHEKDRKIEAMEQSIIAKCKEFQSHARVGERQRPAASLDSVLKIEGQLSQYEAMKLMDLTMFVQPEHVIVEIGCYRGRSTAALATGSLMHRQNKVYSIDPHETFTGILGGQFGPEDQRHFYANILEAGVGEIVAAISLPSLQVARSWPDKNIGLLWIDGDHRYESVRADSDAWLPFVVDRGIIAFHGTHIPDVRRVIDETTAQGAMQPSGAMGTIAWFKKC